MSNKKRLRGKKPACEAFCSFAELCCFFLAGSGSSSGRNMDWEVKFIASKINLNNLKFAGV